MLQGNRKGLVHILGSHWSVFPLKSHGLDSANLNPMHGYSTQTLVLLDGLDATQAYPMRFILDELLDGSSIHLGQRRPPFS
jgi:hypothetical protein